ncbi:MAG: hypothetical protein PUC47_09805, partial [Oscillospiraceae bacterium]|nr:hypothetical protein [Oscillospiraceae bacterium]
ILRLYIAFRKRKAARTQAFLRVSAPFEVVGIRSGAEEQDFALCGARPRLCLWNPRFFEKNRVKL